MATAQYTCLEQIGDTAGMLWHYLNDHGPRTVSQLVKDVDAPRDVIMQAVGWLAREGKVLIEEDRGKKTVGLRS
jgi:hypothetical protein